MAGEDPDYIDWLGTKPCATGCGKRSGPPHHPRHASAALGGVVGLSMRAHDHRAVPLSQECHDSIHRLTCGFFKGWHRQQVRDFLDELALKYRSEYERTHPRSDHGN